MTEEKWIYVDADYLKELEETAKKVDYYKGIIDGINMALDRKTEPKPICESCSKNPCKKKEMINAIGHWVSECTEFDRKTEPSFTATDFGKGTITKYTDEPQTDCSWKKGE